MLAFKTVLNAAMSNPFFAQSVVKKKSWTERAFRLQDIAQPFFLRCLFTVSLDGLSERGLTRGLLTF